MIALLDSQETDRLVLAVVARMNLSLARLYAVGE